MINLLPWREQRFSKRRMLAFILIAIGYLFLFVASDIFFSKAYDERNRWLNSIQQLRQEVDQLQQHSKSVLKKGIAQQQLVTANAIVWKRYNFIKKTIQLIIGLPKFVVLSRIHCMKENCNIVLNAKNIGVFSLLFPNYHVQDVKQGNCPLCYQIEATAPL